MIKSRNKYQGESIGCIVFCCLVIMSLVPWSGVQCSGVAVQCVVLYVVGQQMLPPVTDVNPQGKTATPDYLNIYQYYRG